MELQNKIAVITGASSGIGKATAEVLLKKGCIVFGLSRREAAIMHSSFTNIKCDVGDLKQVESAIEKIIGLYHNIHILINNAGLGYFGKIDEMSVEKWHEMFNTNVHGIFYGIRTVVPHMKKNNLGHIINISSIAGRQAVMEGSGYSATKFAVRAIGESIYRELRPFNIKLTTIYPGSTNTAFFDHVENKLRAEDMMTPEDIAGSVLNILETNDNYLPYELEVRTMRAR